MRFLDWKVSEINKLIGIRRKETQELEALKSAVISDTVTGKIDVRNIIVPEYEHVDDIADDDSECDEESDETEMDEEV
ncbi:hypothetical protein BTI53_07825 [Lactobacillus delbrueckii subsp. bulgaricus]|nr:hypothetical protein [Lactobacillus delbrueckii subsp. bulgaricus]